MQSYKNDWKNRYKIYILSHFMEIYTQYTKKLANPTHKRIFIHFQTITIGDKIFGIVNILLELSVSFRILKVNKPFV